MKKTLVNLLFLIIISSISFAQPVRTQAAGAWTGDTSPMINSMNAASTDTSYWQYFGWGPSAGHLPGGDSLGGHYEVNINAFQDSGYVNISYDTDVKAEGTGSMKLDVSVHGTEGWGGYSKIQHMHPDTANGFYDWSKYDTVSFQYYMPSAPSHAGAIELRFNVLEFSDVTDPTYVPADGDGGKPLGEFYYSFTSPRLGDATTEWVTVDIPLVNSPDNWNNATGFNRTGWAGIAGNEVFDTDKIKGFTFEFSGNQTDSTRSSATIYIDNLTLKGRKNIPVVMFNGKSYPSTIVPFTWGDSQQEIIDGGGPGGVKSAVKWTHANPWGNGYTGYGYNMNADNGFDMSFEWMTDSVQFTYKSEVYTGPLRLQFEAGTGKLVNPVTLTADNDWHTVKVALKDFVYGDGTTAGFDSTAVKVFQFIPEGNGVAGNVVHLTDIWTGAPIFDWVPPAAVENIAAIPGTYTNAVVWDDVAGEKGETYDVYASRKAFTDTSAKLLAANTTVDVVATGVLEDVMSAYHDITIPLSARSVQYYYAVICTDSNGNKSIVSQTAAPTYNFARGIPTLSLTPPAFAADGDIAEWEASGIVPLFMGVSSNSLGAAKVWQTVDSDDDASLKIYLAADEDSLYVGVDVTDDVFHVGAGNWWEQDAMELFIGLYDQRGPKHGAAKRGAEPDYKFAFLGDSAFVEFGTSTPLSDKSYVTYANSGVTGSPDAVIEFSINLDSLAKINSDSVFVPTEGMRIAIEPAWHDNDGEGWQGNLFMSKNNNDNAWQTPSVWSHTFVGRKDGNILSTDDEGLVATRFELKENYPNPFNPTTTIEYSIGIAGQTKLMIYDVLGREMVKLVDEYRPMGTHRIVWNAANMPSGIYFYRLETSTFTRTQKMVLMK